MGETQVKQFSIQLEDRITQAYATLRLGEPTKKIRKLISKSARRIGKEIKAHLDEEAKREAKAKKKALKANKVGVKKKTPAKKEPA